MNKKEQAEFEAAKKAVFVARALNWSEPVPRDVAVPVRGHTTGWVYNANLRSPCVMKALSSSTGHATTWESNDFPVGTSTQRGISMYSTRLLALRAMRHEIECEVAEILAGIDIEIQKELLL